jgi:hypothetical protein
MLLPVVHHTIEKVLSRMSLTFIYQFCERVTHIAQLLERLGVKVKRYYLRHLSVDLVIGFNTVPFVLTAIPYTFSRKTR